MAGQSNMEGYGFSKDTPTGICHQPNVMIFCGNPERNNIANGGLGIWAPLSCGFGTNFKSDGKTNFLSDRFGPEISFAFDYCRSFPEEKLAIIKYAKGGSSLEPNICKHGSWLPNNNDSINQLHYLKKCITVALEKQDINNDGKKDSLVFAGILWMQGEADAYYSEVAANKYYENLKTTIESIRHIANKKNLPVFIAKIIDSGMDSDGKKMDYFNKVITAQQHLIIEDNNAVYVDGLENVSFLNDGWHFTSIAYLELGTLFSKAVTTFLNKQ